MSLDLPLSEASGVPLYRQVQDRLAERVASGALPPGTMLPSVRELAADLRVSAITIRRAYAELQAAGLIVKRQGRGTFVADQVSAQLTDLARTQAEEALVASVDLARRLGLNDDEIRAVVAAHMKGGER